MSDIRFTCPKCNQPLEAPPDMGGESIDCPKCKNPIKVPQGPQIKSSSPFSAPLLAEVEKSKKCPFCSEQILADALKCRFCGEFLDGSKKTPPPLNRIEQVSPPNPPHVIVKEKGEGCFLQTLNCGCVVVVGIIIIIVIIVVYVTNS